MTAPITLHSLSVSTMDNNCYLLVSGNKGLLIDAADDAPALLALADGLGVSIETVVTTHRHADHVRALRDVLAATGATHLAPAPDAEALPAPVDLEDSRSPQILTANSTSLLAIASSPVA